MQKLKKNSLKWININELHFILPLNKVGELGVLVNLTTWKEGEMEEYKGMSKQGKIDLAQETLFLVILFKSYHLKFKDQLRDSIKYIRIALFIVSL